MSRRPCKRCGGNKEPGQGAVLCPACRDANPAGKCSCCGGPKPSGQGRRLCDDCKPITRGRTQVRPCVKCGGYAPKAVGHRFCPECEVIEKEATEARKRARRSLQRKPCFRCGKPKGPGRRKKLCDRCHADLHSTARVCASCGQKKELGKFKRLCEQCRLEARARYRERQRLNEQVYRTRRREKERRRKSQRIYDQKNRARKLENQRMRYHLAQGGIKRHINVAVAMGQEMMWRLPAQPLAVALDRLIALEQIGNPYSGLPDDPHFARTDAVCRRVGISSRTLLAWRTGQRKEVQWDLADAILTYTDLAWWDVWNEETVPDAVALAKVKAIFEGTGSVAA